MKKLDEKFGIESKEVEILPPPSTNVVPANIEIEDTQAQEDYNIARETILDVLQIAGVATSHAHEIAKDKEDSRSFEALNSLLKTRLDAAKHLKEIHGNKKEEKAAPKDNNVTNNNVFVGTPKQLREMLNSMKQK